MMSETKAKKSKETLDSKYLIKDSLDTDLKLFKGVEIIVQVLCAAAVKISVKPHRSMPGCLSVPGRIQDSFHENG